MISVLPIVAMLASFMALLLAAFLALVPSETRLANALLAFFLVATAIDISGWFTGDLLASCPRISSFRAVIAMLQMPLFTGFIWLNCFQRNRLLRHDIVHFLPAVIILGFAIADADIPYLRLLFELQYVVYISIAIFALWRIRQLMHEKFIGQSINWRWLAILVLTSLVAHNFFVLRSFFAPNVSEETSGNLQAVAALLVLAITVWIAFKALLTPSLFRRGDRLLVAATQELGDATEDEHRRLIMLMEDQNLYLDPDISLSRLARRAGITVKDLSATINQRHGLHFFDFINGYRIGHAKRLLSKTEQSVAEIVYASGFNSKSSFNSAFRKHAGMTPSTYRKTNRQ